MSDLKFAGQARGNGPTSFPRKRHPPNDRRLSSLGSLSSLSISLSLSFHSANLLFIASYLDELLKGIRQKA